MRVRWGCGESVVRVWWGSGEGVGAVWFFTASPRGPRGYLTSPPSLRFRVADAATDDAILRLSSLVVLVVGIVGYLH